MMQRTDFKNLKRNELVSFVSKIGELRPEVAKEVLAQYPEFIGLMKVALPEYQEMINAIIESDDASIKEYYNIANKEMDSATESRKQFYDFVKQMQADCSKLLDNQKLSHEQTLEIIDRQLEFAKMAYEKDTEIREQEKEIEDKVNKKDSEKRAYNWKLVGGISLALMSIAGVSAGVLGGKFDLHLPKKNQ